MLEAILTERGSRFQSTGAALSKVVYGTLYDGYPAMKTRRVLVIDRIVSTLNAPDFQ